MINMNPIKNTRNVSELNTIKCIGGKFQGTFISGGTTIVEKRAFIALSTGKFKDCVSRKNYPVKVESAGRKVHKIDMVFINHETKRIDCFDSKSAGYPKTVDPTHAYKNHFRAKEILSKDNPGYMVNYSILKVGGITADHFHDEVEKLGIQVFDLEKYCEISIENSGWKEIFYDKIDASTIDTKQQYANIEAKWVNLKKFMDDYTTGVYNNEVECLDPLIGDMLKSIVQFQLKINNLI